MAIEGVIIRSQMSAVIGILDKSSTISSSSLHVVAIVGGEILVQLLKIRALI